MDWPPCNPDLDFIGNLWRAMKHELYRLYPDLHELKNNTADMEILTALIKEVLECIDQEHIPKLVVSIPTQLDACQNTEG